MKHTMHTRIVDLTRRMNSPSGNPRYDVTFANGMVIRTWPDAAFANGIENSEYRNTEVTVTLERGFIIDVTPGITD